LNIKYFHFHQVYILVHMGFTHLK